MGNAAGKSLPFTLSNDPVRFKHGSLWTVNHGKGVDGSPHAGYNVLVWRYDKRAPAAQSAYATLVSNAFKRMRMLRHPNVVKCIDGQDNEESSTLVTEDAQPLSTWIEEHRGDADYEASCLWGLYSLCSALAFLHNDCKMIHGCLTTDSVLVTKGGDFKLAGFELLSDASGSGGADIPDRHLTSNDQYGTYPSGHKPPERASREWGLLSAPERRHALDCYSLGLLIAEVFTGFGNPITGVSDHKAIAEGSWPGIAAVPPALRSLLPKLLGPVRTRATATDVLECAWFKQPLVGALLFLDELALKEPKDKQRFFSSLPGLLPRFPSAIKRYRVLPSLVQALEYGAAAGGGGGTVVLGPILDIGSELSAEEYAKDITPCVVKLFASNDRATRVHLLTALPSFIDKMDANLVNTSIFPAVLNGFSDTNAVLRESTVKAAVHFAPRLTPANFGSHLLRALKGCLADPEPAIRVNSTICLGRIADHAEVAARNEVLLPCFLRGMRDPFPFARAAALRAVGHCMSLGTGTGTGGDGAKQRSKTDVAPLHPFWDADTVAKRIMAAACHLALDPVGDVRSAAHSVLELGIKQMREEGERLAKIEAQQAAAAAAAASNAAAAGEPGGAAATPHGSSSSSAAAAGAASGVSAAFGWAVTSIAGLAVSGSMDQGAQVAGGSVGASTPSTPSAAGHVAARPVVPEVGSSRAAAAGQASSTAGATSSNGTAMSLSRDKGGRASGLGMATGSSDHLNLSHGAGGSNTSAAASGGGTGGDDGWGAMDDDDLGGDDHEAPVKAIAGLGSSNAHSGSGVKPTAGSRSLSQSGLGSRAKAAKQSSVGANDGWGATDDGWGSMGPDQDGEDDEAQDALQVVPIDHGPAGASAGASSGSRATGLGRVTTAAAPAPSSTGSSASASTSGTGTGSGGTAGLAKPKAMSLKSAATKLPTAAASGAGAGGKDGWDDW